MLQTTVFDLQLFLSHSSFVYIEMSTYENNKKNVQLINKIKLKTESIHKTKQKQKKKLNELIQQTTINNKWQKDSSIMIINKLSVDEMRKWNEKSETMIGWDLNVN